MSAPAHSLRPPNMVQSSATIIDRPDTDFARQLRHGLRRPQKQIPCKYFYDREGSALFEAIAAMPDYYQTRTELALLAAYAGEIAALIGNGAEIVEFGAGSSRKIRLLLAAADAKTYMPIDISGAYLREVSRLLAADHPGVAVRPLVGDFTKALLLPEASGRRIGFFPGSTIGNFAPQEAESLLRRFKTLLAGGGLLIGVDLVKDPAILHAAYNDADGITASFNKNLLARANRELGAGFDLSAFAHYAPYDPIARRIEMYLVSLGDQQVRLGGETIHFAEGEAIHTEDSHKYTIGDFRDLAARAGFRPGPVWIDPERLFAIHWLES
jgi:dimethylhistidine N-methyltransferase